MVRLSSSHLDFSSRDALGQAEWAEHISLDLALSLSPEKAAGSEIYCVPNFVDGLSGIVANHLVRPSPPLLRTLEQQCKIKLLGAISFCFSFVLIRFWYILMT